MIDMLMVHVTNPPALMGIAGDTESAMHGKVVQLDRLHWDATEAVGRYEGSTTDLQAAIVPFGFQVVDPEQLGTLIRDQIPHWTGIIDARAADLPFQERCALVRDVFL